MKGAVRAVTEILLVRTSQAALGVWAVSRILRKPILGPGSVGAWAAPFLSVYFLYVFLARWRWGRPILTTLPGNARRVALTFDDGPSPEVTPRILDALWAGNAKATFFVLGEAAARHPDLIPRILNEGHALAVHGWDHTPLVLPAASKVTASLRRALTALPPGRAAHLRPPYGFKSLTLEMTARRLGLRLTGWSLDTGDYAARDAAQVIRQTLARVHPGAILLLHDGPDNGRTADALPAILDGLRAQSFETCLLPGNPSDNLHGPD